jgi:hypothetical protein
MKDTELCIDQQGIAYAMMLQRMNYHASCLPFAPQCPNAPLLGQSRTLPGVRQNTQNITTSDGSIPNPFPAQETAIVGSVSIIEQSLSSLNLNRPSFSCRQEAEDDN